MTEREIRQAFLAFFADRAHQIVPSAPMVVKNDPTLMFTNAGFWARRGRSIRAWRMPSSS